MIGLAATYRKAMTPGFLILAFFLAYALAGITFQYISKIPPWFDGSPVDILTGSMIWMTCIIALLMASLTADNFWKSLMWLAGSAALGVVALDELFGMHEHAAKFRDDDDPKIIMAIGAGVALSILAKVQELRSTPLYLLIAGFVIHCLYLLSDLGDGDFFDVTMGNPDRLRVVEECLEFSAMGCYLAAFILILLAALPARSMNSVTPPAE